MNFVQMLTFQIVMRSVMQKNTFVSAICTLVIPLTEVCTLVSIKQSTHKIIDNSVFMVLCQACTICVPLTSAEQSSPSNGPAEPK